jgi:hypothetical protein
MPVRLVVVVATLAGLTGVALAGSAAAKARYPQGLWTGITYGNNYSKFTFRLTCESPVAERVGIGAVGRRIRRR